MALLVEVACGVLILWLAVKLMQTIQSYRTKAKGSSWIPGPPAIPLLGNVQLLGLSKEEIFGWKTSNFRKYGNFFKIMVLNEPKVFVLGSEMMKPLLQDPNVTKGDLYQEGPLSIMSGLINLEGDRWHRAHKMLVSSFHLERLETIPREIIPQVKDLLTQLNQHVDTGLPFSINHSLQAFTTSVSLNLLFGFDYDAIQKFRDRCITFTEAVDISTQSAFRRLVNPIYHLDWIFELTSLYRDFKMANETIKSVAQEIINYRKESGLDDKVDLISNEKCLIFYDILIKNLKKGLCSEQEISWHTMEILIASSETTTTALQSLIFCVGTNQQVQDRLREEIDPYSERVLSGEMSYKELNNLDYLDRVVKESMRLIPPADLITRRTTTPLKTSEGVIPSGTEVILDILNTHYDPGVWPHPERFDPDRFLPDISASRDSFSYLPFGAGLRKCIGYRMGNAILKTCLIAILSEYKIVSLEKLSDIKFYSSQVIRCVPNPHIKLYKRVKTC